jgi:hypothetical protein
MGRSPFGVECSSSEEKAKKRKTANGQGGVMAARGPVESFFFLFSEKEKLR